VFILEKSGGGEKVQWRSFPSSSFHHSSRRLVGAYSLFTSRFTLSHLASDLSSLEAEKKQQATSTNTKQKADANLALSLTLCSFSSERRSIWPLVALEAEQNQKAGCK